MKTLKKYDSTHSAVRLLKGVSPTEVWYEVRVSSGGEVTTGWYHHKEAAQMVYDTMVANALVNE